MSTGIFPACELGPRLALSAVATSLLLGSLRRKRLQEPRNGERRPHRGSIFIPVPSRSEDPRSRPQSDNAPAITYLVLNFSDPPPPDVLAYATPIRFPLRLMNRYLSSGM